ncbi:hypothetical protein EJB05_33945, partial [Eragrostis curvula]
MDKAIGNQASKVVKKGKKKQAKDELDRQKQAEKKRRRLEKALANSAAIISELEKKKQKKKEEQQRLDEEGAAIAEAVALHVLRGEDSDEPCHLMLNKHRKCNHWDPSAAFDFTQVTDIYPSDGFICVNHPCAPKGRWTDWEIGQPLPSWGEVRDFQAPCYQGASHQSVTCPGFIAAQAVSSLQIREESLGITSPSKGAAAATVSLSYGEVESRRGSKEKKKKKKAHSANCDQRGKAKIRPSSSRQTQIAWGPGGALKNLQDNKTLHLHVWNGADSLYQKSPIIDQVLILKKESSYAVR